MSPDFGNKKGLESLDYTEMLREIEKRKHTLNQIKTQLTSATTD